MILPGTERKSVCIYEQERENMLHYSELHKLLVSFPNFPTLSVTPSLILSYLEEQPDMIRYASLYTFPS